MPPQPEVVLPPPPAPVAESRRADALRLGLIALAYAFTLKLSLFFPDAAGILTGVWPPGGVALAALLLSRRRQWRGILATIFITGIVVDLLSGRPALASLGFMAADVLEPWGCAWLMTRWCGERVTFGRVREVLALAAGAAVVNGATALVGAAAATLASDASFGEFYLTWWISDGLGILLVTPLVVVCAAPWPRFSEWRRPRVFEALALGLVSCLCTWLGFLSEASGLPVVPHPYWICAPLVWAALRFGVRGTILLLPALAVIAVGATSAHPGFFPLGGRNPAEHLQMVQLFLSVMSLTGLVLAAAVTERELGEAKLRQSRQWLQGVVEGTSDAVYIKDVAGRYLLFNGAASRFVGKGPAEVIGRDDKALFPPEEAKGVMEGDRQVMNGGQTVTYEEQVTTADGKRRIFSSTKGPMFGENGRVIGLFGVARDVTERRWVDEEREITVELLRLANESRSIRDLVQAAVAFFQRQSGCEAVGIRLCDAGDYPYFETRGFPAEFIRLETRLCARDAAGQTIRDSSGNPVLECMCGNVICGRFDPSKPFFTAQGSFWTNGTTALLASTAAADRQARTRNRCNGEGYESVALIPLRCGENRLGLLQLNDRRPGQFAAQTIALWERLSGYLAIALAKLSAEEQALQALAEKEVLLKEIHHRVKNNLQVVSGLLELQAERLRDPEVRSVLKESQSRIRSMALVHETLYQSPGLSRLDFRTYVQSLVAHLFHAQLNNGRVVRFDLRMPSTTLGLTTAVPCGLIINELVTNALKHAFAVEPPPRPDCEIVLSWEDAGENWRLTVADNGAGIPAGVDWTQPHTLGLRLAQMLTRQLKGTVRLEPGPGCRFVVEFPKP